MKLDDIVYLGLLAGSIGFGQVYRRIEHVGARKWTGTIVGLLVTFMVSGWHTLHPLFLTAANIAIIHFVSKSLCHVVSFWFSFAYLLFFRLSHYVGLAMVPSHTNAVQMMITLKLIGICFEVHDTWKKEGELKKEDSEDKKAEMQQALRHEEVHPSPMDIFHYAFCYIGVLTGPYYKYKVYDDMIQSVYLNKNGLDCLQAMLNRIWVVPLYAVAFLLSDYYFPLSFAESEEIFEDYGFFYRMWYMTPVFFNFRMRIYAGFVLSECVCIMAGLGAYPRVSDPKPGRGPTKYQPLDSLTAEDSKLEYTFDTIHNIDEYGADFTPTVRTGMRCWNMTVQYWLANNVYKRLKLARPIREALTMLASAYWHGVHSGYYLSMLTVPFILAVEDYYDRLVRRKLGETGQSVYDWFSWFVKMQNFAYMGMAFLLLRVDTTLHYWQSIGYLYHGLIIIMHCIAQYINLIIGKAQDKLKKSQATAVIDDYTKMRFLKTKDGEPPPTPLTQLKNNGKAANVNKEAIE